MLAWRSSVRWVLLVLMVVAACTPAPTSRTMVDVRVEARFQTDGSPLLCPPVCLETEGPEVNGEDPVVPLFFTVCSSATGCFPLEAGVTATVSSDVTVRAPDGVTHTEQLPAFEQKSPLAFVAWHDGGTQNPRPVALSSSESEVAPAALFELVAIYHLATLNDPSKAAIQAGCPASDVELILSNKQWTNVKPVPPRFYAVEGPVASAYLSNEDYFGTHYSQDYIVWVRLSDEEPYKMLAEKAGQFGSRPNQIQIEWETGSFPTWARPWGETPALDEPTVPLMDDGDRVWAFGSWIFDCGHQDDAIFQGAWTEIHPPIAMATMRGTRQGKLMLREDLESYITDLHDLATGLEGVKVDLWMNGDGGKATEVVNGVNAHPLDGEYEFDVPLPPTPAPLDTRAEFRIEVLRLEEGQPRPTITRMSTPEGDVLRVNLDLRGYGDTWHTCRAQNQLPLPEELSNCRGEAYGATIIAGWETFGYPSDLRRVRVTLDDVKAYDDMEGENGDGEFKLDLEIGPSAALGGPVLEQTTSVHLHAINHGLNDADGHGESYPMTRDGVPVSFLFNVRDDPQKTEGNFVALRLEGYEDDPIWDDDIPTMSRAFYATYTLWDRGLPPSWAGCGPLPTPTCPYGQEEYFGTERQGSVAPIVYEDGIIHPSDRAVGSQVLSLGYRIELVPPPVAP